MMDHLRRSSTPTYSRRRSVSSGMVDSMVAMGAGADCIRCPKVRHPPTEQFRPNASEMTRQSGLSLPPFVGPKPAGRQHSSGDRVLLAGPDPLEDIHRSSGPPFGPFPCKKAAPSGRRGRSLKHETTKCCRRYLLFHPPTRVALLDRRDTQRRCGAGDKLHDRRLGSSVYLFSRCAATA